MKLLDKKKKNSPERRREREREKWGMKGCEYPGHTQPRKKRERKIKKKSTHRKAKNKTELLVR